MTQFSRALVIGDTGGIGAAIAEDLRARGVEVVGLSRRSDPPLDLTDEASIVAAIDSIPGAFDLVFIDGHPEASYDHVVNLIDTVRAAGAERIGIASLKEGDAFRACTAPAAPAAPAAPTEGAATGG